MILVLNRDVVLLEMVELARLKIAQVFSCDPCLVQAEIGFKEGKPIPTFGVPEVVAEGLDIGDVKEVVSSIYWSVRHELTERLEHLDDRRA